MEGGQVHGEARDLDEDSEEAPNLRARFAAAVLAGVRWKRREGRSQVESAWTGRGQSPRFMQRSSSWTREPTTLEW